MPADPPAASLSAPSLADLAAQHGLSRSTTRQPMLSYARDVWSRRDFIVALASGRNSAEYQDTALGKAWQVLAPLLNALVYYLVFGLLLGTNKGIPNYTAFLIIGVFTFTYTTRCVNGGTRAIARNRQLIRAVHFPRAVLPVAVVIQGVQQQLVSMLILVVIVLVTGEPLTVLWLTIPVILVLQTMFNAGIAMMFARFTAASADVTQLVPFLLQTWRYFSGVFFSIAVFTAHKPPWVRDLMWANPATTYMELMRDVMMTSHMAPAKLWLYALAWGVAMLVVGFWVFHRAEESYARG